ncbi:MAG TPA: M56 family metallopeptidase [Candidatus Solibacter sp.]|nr:M56 family metallopeptidase [Candidatus Solibacter sp.]
MSPITQWFSEPWAERLGWALVYFIWQGAAIALLLAVARIWIRSPRARHAAACLALAAMVLAPAVTFAWWEPAGVSGGVVADAPPPPPPPPDGVLRGAVSPGVMPWVVMVWLAGIVVLSARLAASWISVARMRTARPAPAEWQQVMAGLASRMGIARTVRLLVSPLVDVPAVLGWLRPVVLAPVAALSGLAPEHVEALLAHELAHIRRHDYLINVVQGVVETLLFYHPAVWWVSRQIRQERELCCDDLAVAATSDVLTYARALAELEACRPPAAAAIAANSGSLVQRIARLLEPGRAQRTLPRPAAIWALSALIATGIAGFAMRASAQDQTAPVVSRDQIWTDTVRRGDLQIQVRGLGKLLGPNLAEVRIAETQSRDLKPGQEVTIDYRGDQLLHGKVSAVGTQPTAGTITVTVATAGLPPSAGRPPLEIDATILIGTVPNVIMVGRPVFGSAESSGTLYRIEPDGQHAVPVPVVYGKSSVNTIEIRSGLAPGDKVILSDMSAYEQARPVKLK